MVLFLSGCITEEKCNQRFPGSVKTETVFYDTVIITSKQHFDTLFKFSADTIFLKDQKTKIEVKVIKLKGDSIFIRSECPPDTVIVTKIRSETTIERLLYSVVKSFNKNREKFEKTKYWRFNLSSLLDGSKDGRHPNR